MLQKHIALRLESVFSTAEISYKLYLEKEVLEIRTNTERAQNSNDPFSSSFSRLNPVVSVYPLLSR
jgi:hypothetical protein